MLIGKVRWWRRALSLDGSDAGVDGIRRKRQENTEDQGVTTQNRAKVMRELDIYMRELHVQTQAAARAGLTLKNGEICQSVQMRESPQENCNRKAVAAAVAYLVF